MTLRYTCSNCGEQLETTNADPLNDQMNALVKALVSALLIAKQEWDFPGAHPHRAAVVRDMEAALAAVGSAPTPSAPDALAPARRPRE